MPTAVQILYSLTPRSAQPEETAVCAATDLTRVPVQIYMYIGIDNIWMLHTPFVGHLTLPGLRHGVESDMSLMLACLEFFPAKRRGGIFLYLKTIGDLAILGIAKNRFTTTDHHRCRSDGDLKVIEKWAHHLGSQFPDR